MTVTIRDLFVPFEDELQLLPSKRVPNPPLIEWKSAFGDVFFRIKGAEPEVLWCMPGIPVGVGRVSRFWRGCRYFRVVPFDDGEDWALMRPKFVFVKSPHQPMGALWKWEAPFREKMTHRKWLQKSQDQLRELLQTSENDLSLQMARQSAALDVNARTVDARTLSSSPFFSIYQRWEQLTRAALTISLSNSNLPTKILALPRKSVDGPVLFDYVDTQLRIISSHFFSPISRNTQALLDTLQRHLLIPFWRNLSLRGDRWSEGFKRFTFDSISQHERLEAALLWRDFGREIGKSNEVEALLRELLS